MTDRPDIREHTLTCETQGCENQSIPISLPTSYGSTCICGACGYHITNVVVGAVIPPVDIPIDMPTAPNPGDPDTTHRPAAPAGETL